MSESESSVEIKPAAMSKFPIIAAIVAIIGVADSVYLTIQHFSGEQIPCGITGGCERVLTSAYSELFGVPIAAFGAIAYFAAFSLAILAYYGNRLMWKLFGLQAVVMFLFSAYLTYVQAFVISNSQVPVAERFCQYCLLSAATSTTLFLIAIFSRFWRS